MKYKLSLLTSEKILELSNGEVRVPDTFNYRYKIPKAVLGGLFCEKTFGPIENYKCQCGQLIGKEYDGTTCRKCGVEVGSSFLRHKRMGHIELPFPIIHPLTRIAIFKIFGKFEDLVTGKLGIKQTEDENGSFINKKGKRISLEYINALTQNNYEGFKLLPETILNIDWKETANINKVVNKIISNGINPEHYVLQRLPVTPPGYRPVIEMNTTQILDEINIHYMKIIKRKLHLQHLQQYPTPKVIMLWGRHLLQRAVDGLMLYGDTNLGKKVKPIIDKLKKKEGRLRGNLLGKRVDYSGRSITVGDPSIPSDTMKLPIKMAYELFKPFIIGRLYRRKKNYRKAKQSYLVKTKEAYDELYEICKTHRVMVNRQPTLHKYGLVAFKIQLHHGRTIQMPPPVFGGFNLDSDGDQMAVYIPLFQKALDECKNLMMPYNNIISSCNSQPILSLTHEIIIGLYVITKIKEVENPKLVASYSEAEYLYQSGVIDISEQISFRKENTCFGRMLISKILGFEVTDAITKNQIRKITNRCFDLYSREEVIKILDELKEIGFEQATLYGLSIGMDDVKVPSTKYEKFAEVEKYCESLVDEKSNEKKVRMWYNTIRDLKDVALEELGENNPLKIMLDTGARVKASQIVQLVVAKGLISNWKGEILEPIRNSFAEGLNTFEYFTQVYGARKSMADKKFITPLSGYLARRIITATRDLYIVKKDCGTTKTIKINGIERRSPITCEAKGGICQKCYGVDPATRKRIRNGIPIGVIAGQSISEPSTQLSMQQFHTGGAAQIKSSPLNVKTSIEGICSVDVLNENISRVSIIDVEKREYFININFANINIKEGQEVKKDDIIATYHQDVGQEDISGTLGTVEHYYEAQTKLPKSILSLESGIICLKVNELDNNFIDIFINNNLQGSADKFALHYGSGDYVEKGTMLTHGEVYLKEAYEKLGLEITGNLFVKRLFELYKEEGAVISPVHFEVIFRAMTEIVVDNEGNLNCRRMLEEKDIKKVLFKGITQVGKIYPSWLKKICFGWVKQCLEDCSMKEQISMDLPSERILTGELIKNDTNV